MSWILEADSRLRLVSAHSEPYLTPSRGFTDLHMIEVEWCVPAAIASYSSLESTFRHHWVNHKAVVSGV